MSSSVTSFRPVTGLNELKMLETSLEEFYPNSLQMLNIIRLKMKNMYPQDMDITLHVYDEEGSKETSRSSIVPFVVSIQAPNVHSLYGVLSWCPIAPSPKAMAAYESLIDWNRLHFLTTVFPSFSPTLKTLLDLHGNTSVHKDGIPGVIYYMDRSKALEFIPPSNSTSFQIKSLDSSLAAKIVSNWKFAAPHSTRAISSSLSSLPSVGIFVDGELASSALLVPIGYLGILHTEEKHRRKGYGELTMLTLCKEVAKAGLTPAVEIEATNERSMALMKKIGFSYLSDIERFYFAK